MLLLVITIPDYILLGPELTCVHADSPESIS